MSWRMITPAGVTISPFKAVSLVFSYLFCSKSSDKFNIAFTDLVKSKKTWTYANGRDALFEGLKAVKSIKPDKDQVLMPVYTCQTVLKSILSAGLTPVLYDIDSCTLGSSAAQISPKINDNTLAVIAGGIFGISINMQEIQDLTREKNIYLIEDVAQCLGCTYENKAIGSFGDISIYSFGQSKPIAALGGGALTTKDNLITSAISKDYDKLEHKGFFNNLKLILHLFISSIILKPFFFYLLTSFKNSFKPQHDRDMIRTKKMSEFNATIANAQILNYNRTLETRKQNAKLIQEAIKNKEGIQCMEFNMSGNNTYLRLPMICDDVEARNKWIKKLKSIGLWASDLLYEPIYKHTKESDASFPLLSSVKDKLIIISTHPFINEKDINNLKQLRID